MKWINVNVDIDLSFENIEQIEVQKSLKMWGHEVTETFFRTFYLTNKICMDGFHFVSFDQHNVYSIKSL